MKCRADKCQRRPTNYYKGNDCGLTSMVSLSLYARGVRCRVDKQCQQDSRLYQGDFVEIVKSTWIDLSPGRTILLTPVVDLLARLRVAGGTSYVFCATLTTEVGR